MILYSEIKQLIERISSGSSDIEVTADNYLFVLRLALAHGVTDLVRQVIYEHDMRAVHKILINFCTKQYSNGRDYLPIDSEYEVPWEITQLMAAHPVLSTKYTTRIYELISPNEIGNFVLASYGVKNSVSMFYAYKRAIDLNLTDVLDVLVSHVPFNSKKYIHYSSNWDKKLGRFLAQYNLEDDYYDQILTHLENVPSSWLILSKYAPFVDKLIERAPHVPKLHLILANSDRVDLIEEYYHGFTPVEQTEFVENIFRSKKTSIIGFLADRGWFPEIDWKNTFTSEYESIIHNRNYHTTTPNINYLKKLLCIAKSHGFLPDDLIDKFEIEVDQIPRIYPKNDPVSSPTTEVTDDYWSVLRCYRDTPDEFDQYISSIEKIDRDILESVIYESVLKQNTELLDRIVARLKYLEDSTDEFPFTDIIGGVLGDKVTFSALTSERVIQIYRMFVDYGFDMERSADHIWFLITHHMNNEIAASKSNCESTFRYLAEHGTDSFTEVLSGFARMSDFPWYFDLIVDVGFDPVQFDGECIRMAINIDHDEIYKYFRELTPLRTDHTEFWNRPTLQLIMKLIALGDIPKETNEFYNDYLRLL